MDNKLPRVYVNNQNKKIANNIETYYSKEKKFDDLSNNSKDLINNLIIKKKINEIFSSSRFIYKTKVLIKTEDEDREEIIIAKTKNSLLTYENKIIPICIIKDIILL